MIEQSNKYNGKVLVVDDDRDYSDGLVDIIKPNNYQTDQAFTKTQAIEKLESFDPDVILLDLRLGRSNGVDILNEVKQRNHPAMCILLTAYSSVDSAIDALRQGAYDYLQKPVPPEKLINIIENCFDRISMERKIREHQINLEDVISERTAELSESREMYKTLAKVSPVGMMRLDIANKCVYTNDRWTDLICDDTSCLNMKDDWQQCIMPSSHDAFIKAWNAFVKSTDEHFRTECQFGHNNSSKWIIFQASRIENGGFVVTAVDITPQREILPELVEFKKSLGCSHG